ncbi:MAG: S9 family peptidase [Steroidobacteraceae bacterium]|nr:S9 family peptidase [Steroidobacteraceae bacterium]
MRTLASVLILGLLLPATTWSDAMPQSPKPPVAALEPHEVKSPHGTRNDEYYWLRDDSRGNAAVLAHLAAENAYKDAMLAHVKPLQQKLFAEITGRIKPDDASVPYLERGHWYYSRYEKGAEYPVYARKARSLDAPEQVMLDVEALAHGHDFYEIGALEVSPDGRLLAYAEDTVGRRQYTLRFKDLASGRLLPDTITNAEASVAWAADNRTILYIEKDSQTLLGHKVRKHVLGTDPHDDPLVYDEPDETYYVDVGTTKDGRYLYIYSLATLSSEQRYADAADPKLEFSVILPREHDHEYYADHFDGRWIIRTNWQAPNFRLMEAPIGAAADRSQWREIIAHRNDAFVDAFSVFRDFLAIEERSGGLRKVRVRAWRGDKDFYIASDEPAYTTELGDNEEVDSGKVRYTYTSLTTPVTTYDYDVKTGERTLLKQQAVLGGFDAKNYVTEYVWAPARDGVKVPVALVYRKGFRRDGSAPMLQYGYGSYGLSADPAFSLSTVSLLDRGFVYAIAQIRGGQELGRHWYDTGRLLDKQNTFNDFIDATRFLVKEGYADPKRVFAVGRSAGGLLMGAIVNMAPQDYKGIVTAVPFVDVVTTMLDESIPLTTNEYDEWGNPAEKKYHDYMLSYSPYDNVRRQDYPAIYVSTGLWDSQVQYFEPAKWVARLRRLKTDDHPLLFRVNMEAGHSGQSGRFQTYEERAEEYAFILDQAGIRE